MRKRAVCFDLGGVLVKVAYSWEEALSAAGLEIRIPEASRQLLGECPGFGLYQAGKIELDDYLCELTRFLALGSKDEAYHLHQSILLKPFEGTDLLVGELHAKQITTGCLSNTNAAHWEVMSKITHFPAIASLQHPILSQEHNLEKPAEEFYRVFEKISEHQPEEIIYFDDLEENVQGALDCGWTAYRIDPDDDPARQMRLHLQEHQVL